MLVFLSYILIGMKYIAISLIIALTAFVIMHYINKKQTKFTVRHRNMIRWITISLFYYCFLLCVAFLNRSQTADSYNLNLFSSYHSAVFSDDSIERINILLNIILYIPLGLIFANRYCPWKKWYMALTAGLIITIVLEFAQFITKTGYADIDDIYNNFSGVIIGYYFYKYFAGKIQGSRKSGLYLIPLLCPIIIVGIFFIPYLLRSFGYLDCENYNKIKIEDTKITIADNSLNNIDINGNLPIYTTVSLNESDVESFAQTVFKGLGTSIGEEWTIKYDTCMVLFSKKREYELWYEYHDGTFTLQQFTAVEGASLFHGEINESFVRSRLKEIGIFIPSTADISKLNDTDYIIEAKMIEEDGKLYDGTICCKIDNNGQIMKIEYKLLNLQYNSEKEPVSLSKIRDRIETGNFYFQDKDSKYNISITINELTCLSSSIIYQVDTKGYYRPIYKIETNINNKPYYILISAV